MGTIKRLTFLIAIAFFLHGITAHADEQAQTKHKRHASRGLASIGQLRPESYDDSDSSLNGMINSPHEPRLMSKESGSENSRFSLFGSCQNAGGQTAFAGSAGYADCMSASHQPIVNSSAESYYNSTQRQVGGAFQFYP